MRNRTIKIILLAIPLMCLLAVGVYNVPFVHERLAWRLDDIRARIRYAVNPPEKDVFVPQGTAVVQATILLPTQTPSPTTTPLPTSTVALPGATETPLPTPTITPTFTPLPPGVKLQGIHHEYQKWNNCGPATLAMTLSFWGWGGGQMTAAEWLKPNPRDKNVMPYEMLDFIASQTTLKGLVRLGGDLNLLRTFLAAGFPVMIEKGFSLPEEGWMGHYEVLNGYDDGLQRFLAQDSYIGPDITVPYDQLMKYWQHFGYIYLIVYPPEREAEVLAILGTQADETANYQYAAQLASNEIAASTGTTLYYAWFNRGVALMRLQDYSGAAQAFDQAFSVYSDIPEKERPWRMVWYQTGPYFAYYYTGRYYDVISLADTTLSHTQEPALEESFYWRGLAKLALGDNAGAIDDFRKSLEWHPAFAPSLEQLKALGIEP